MQTLDQSDSQFLPILSTPQAGTWRILLGLLQGLLLYALYRTAQDHAWPATQPLLFAPLVLVAFFVPLLLISSLGHLDARRLVLWGAGAAVLLAALGCYDAWRAADLPLAPPTGQPGTHFAVISGVYRSAFPSPSLAFFSATGLFIGHVLVLSAARDRRRIAAYPTYFDGAWTLAVQLAFSGLFTGVSWLVLVLGSQLFELVKLTFLTELIRKEWFSIPVTAFAFACAMHLTDVRPAIVRGIRGLLLVLMSWLLPVIVLLAGGFVASLPFTGLEPLWATRRAAAVLLCTAAVLVVLINAAWQQGGDGSTVARLVRLAARVGALLLAPIVLLAAYALLLRVREYGWTGERVDATACVLVAAWYAVGYFAAALRPGWLPLVARVNTGAAFLVLAVLLALFSPLADPARISVASQVARLDAGKTAAQHFDFVFLRFDGARFGRTALNRLDAQAARANGPDSALVRQRIAAVRTMSSRGDRRGVERTAADLAANLRPQPAGTALPASFLNTDWSNFDERWRLPDCLYADHKRCDALQLDLTGDGKPEVILLPADSPYGKVLSEAAPGQWKLVGTVAISQCGPLRAALLAGRGQSVDAGLRDIEADGMRVRVSAEPPKPEPPCKPGN